MKHQRTYLLLACSKNNPSYFWFQSVLAVTCCTPQALWREVPVSWRLPVPPAPSEPSSPPGMSSSWSCMPATPPTSPPTYPWRRTSARWTLFGSWWSITSPGAAPIGSTLPPSSWKWRYLHLILINSYDQKIIEILSIFANSLSSLLAVYLLLTTDTLLAY